MFNLLQSESYGREAVEKKPHFWEQEMKKLREKHQNMSKDPSLFAAENGLDSKCQMISHTIVFSFFKASIQ